MASLHWTAALVLSPSLRKKLKEAFHEKD